MLGSQWATAVWQRTSRAGWQRCTTCWHRWQKGSTFASELHPGRCPALPAGYKFPLKEKKLFFKNFIPVFKCWLNITSVILFGLVGTFTYHHIGKGHTLVELFLNELCHEGGKAGQQRRQVDLRQNHQQVDGAPQRPQSDTRETLGTGVDSKVDEDWWTETFILRHLSGHPNFPPNIQRFWISQNFLTIQKLNNCQGKYSQSGMLLWVFKCILFSCKHHKWNQNFQICAHEMLVKWLLFGLTDFFLTLISN